ncbi:MAG: radical SAM protein, partial [candidate division WOR-3 bacterium]
NVIHMTNACLVNDDHVRLFQRYPPRDIEVTVYGVTPEVYERISRVPGSYDMFRRGLDRLMAAGIKVRLKAMALRSNIHELPAIAEFCRLRTKDYFRFDPQLHLRFDRDPSRNKEILAERLLPREVAAIEQMDQERSDELERNCDRFIWSTEVHRDCNHLFHCATGRYEFTISSEGRLRLCSSLWAPGTTYDLRQGSLKKAWEDFVPGVLSMESGNPTYRERCRVCKIVNLCLWCPAHAYLETGKMDEWVEYFCQVAHARAEAIKARKNKTISDKEAPTAAAR